MLSELSPYLKTLVTLSGKYMFLTFKLFFFIQVDSEYIPDVSAKYPLCVSGRYHGKLPETLIAKGHLADMSEISIELKVHHVKDIPLDKVRYSILFI